MAAGAYFGRAPQLTDIPNFVSAESPQGLRRAMLQNNLKLRAVATYHSIQFVDGRWYAWFTTDATREGQGLTDGASDNGGNSRVQQLRR